MSALRRAAAHRWGAEAVLGPAVLLLVGALVFKPIPTLLALGGVALVVGLVRVPFLFPTLLIVCMGNVKLNWYLGFFTAFPEYLVLVVACVMALMSWWARPSWPPERRAAVLFMVWALTGVLSVPFAFSVSRVLARVVLLIVCGVTFFTVLATIRSRKELKRAVSLWEIVATLYALFGIIQMVGLVLGFDTSLSFLKGISNPDIYLGVGAPVRRRVGDVLRANSMFNDPNILGGFLAASMSAVLALRFHHAEIGRRGRAWAETLALVVMAACLLLTQSRSGVLALGAGAAVVLAPRLGVLRRGAPWIALMATMLTAVLVSVLVRADPTLLVARLAGTGDTSDLSNRQHLDVFVYGLELIRRFPLFGVGLGNFGLYYGPERDAYFVKMMTHCAPLTYFAETGIPGGLAFCAVWAFVVERVRRTRPATGDSEGRTLRVALLASIVALLLANLFYDYITRTFVWVIAALGVCVARWHDAPEAEATP
jgi:O-antigen ligase